MSYLSEKKRWRSLRDYNYVAPESERVKNRKTPDFSSNENDNEVDIIRAEELDPSSIIREDEFQGLSEIKKRMLMKLMK